MSSVEIAQKDEPIRFVVAARDLEVTRNEIRSTIRAGSLVRADDEVVRDAPVDAFYEPCRYVFHLDISVFGRDDGRFLRKITNTMSEDQLPPPGPNAEANWSRFWESKMRKEGLDPWDVEVECLEGTTYIVRGSISRAVPQAPQITVNVPEQPAPTIVVNVDSEPAPAIVEFQRDPDGRLESATIKDLEENEPNNGQLPD